MCLILIYYRFVSEFCWFDADFFRGVVSSLSTPIYLEGKVTFIVVYLEILNGVNTLFLYINHIQMSIVYNYRIYVVDVRVIK